MRNGEESFVDLVDIARLEERRQAIGTAENSTESEEIGGGLMAFMGKGSWNNQACGLGLDGPVSEDELDRLVAFYVERGVEPRIEVCPFVDKSLIKGLGDRGFIVREFENVLARELRDGEDFRAAMSHGWPEGVELVRVDPDDDAMVTAYVSVSVKAFFADIDEIPEIMDTTARRVVKHPRSDAFLAMLVEDGRSVAVGGGGMEASGEIACLFGAGVVEGYRQRGIQQALIVRRLEQAREKGCRVACIHSLPGISTERNAMRLGFFLAYTKVVMAMAGEGLEVSV